MRYCASLLALGLLAVAAQAQEPNEPVVKNPTHTLQLVQSEGGVPIEIPVKLFEKKDKTFLANMMPDGRLMESEYVLSKEGQFKFQWVAIQRGGLLAIQFIGDKTADGSFTGKFVAVVDGVLRKDMSGQFSLSAREATK
jgi:hypothetical protein